MTSLLLACGSKKTDKSESVKTEAQYVAEAAQNFKDDLIKADTLVPAFLDLLHLKNKMQAKDLQLSEPIAQIYIPKDAKKDYKKFLSYILKPTTINYKVYYYLEGTTVFSVTFYVKKSTKASTASYTFRTTIEDCGTVLKPDSVRKYVTVNGVSTPVGIDTGGVIPIGKEWQWVNVIGEQGNPLYSIITNPKNGDMYGVMADIAYPLEDIYKQ